MAGESPIKIVGVRNNTVADVTGQNELKVTLSESGNPINNSNPLPVTVTSSGTSQDVNIATVDNSVLALGQTTMSSSLPVTLASDQPNIPITIEGPLGQTTMAASTPVVLASDQSALRIKPAPTTGSAFSFNALGQNAEITNLDGQETWDIYVSGAGVGITMMVFGSPDPASVAVQSIPAVKLATGETSITINDTGLYRVNIAGFFKVRLEVTAYGSGTMSGIQLVSYNSSVVSLGSSLPAGTNTLGSVNITSTASITDQTHLHYRNTALTNTVSAVKATAGNLYGIKFINTNATPVYVKLYNIVSGSVVVGTSAISKVFIVPADDGTTPGIKEIDPGLTSLFYASTAITISAVTGLADSDATAPAVAIYAEIIYK